MPFGKKLGNICEKLEKNLGIFGKNRKNRGEIVENFGKFWENFVVFFYEIFWIKLGFFFKSWENL